jgi:Protein of unknown function (DUF3800)
MAAGTHISFCFMTLSQLTAYIDESGTHGHSPMTVMAGFIGYADEWDKFDLKWRDILLANELAYIHGKELWQGTGQFRDRPRWEGSARAALAGLVAPLVLRYARFSLSVILDNAVYDRDYIGGDPKLRKHRHPVDSKYGVCCRTFMSVLARFIERYEGADAQVHLVFEAGHKNSGAAETILAEMYDVAPEIARFISPKITYALKKLSPGVQAADLLAYPVFKGESEGNISFENLAGSPPEAIGNGCQNFRVPILPETLLRVKSGQSAQATLRRQKGRYWTALDGFPVGWSARPLRCVEGFVLTPPRLATIPVSGAEDREILLPAHSVRLRCL